MTKPIECAIERVDVRAYRVPTDLPEADGTYAWDSTTLVAVHVHAGGRSGFGYSYGSAAMVPLIEAELAPVTHGLDAFAIEAAWAALVHQVRNVGRPGIASLAISAIDVALWDLKAKLLDLPLCRLLGEVQPAVAAYGSGGFTTYTHDQLAAQARGWVEAGLRRVKIKIGAQPERDFERAVVVREAIGDAVELMVDANGAYHPSQALVQARELASLDVTWFEEPVSSDDLLGLRCVRDHAPAGMQIAAGEYGYDLPYFRRMLEAGSVDVLQADASRALGITGFLAASRLCQAYGVPLSSHCAPSLHLHAACAAPTFVHLEYFHDHVRLERMLFDGFVSPSSAGTLAPDLSRPGLGVELKAADAARYMVS